MSLSYITISDFTVVIQLAFTLYRQCYLVARGAPQEFQLLVSELTTLSSSLHLLQREVDNPESILVRSGQDRAQMVNEMIKRVEATLLELQNFKRSYEKLLDPSRPKAKKIWDRLKWLYDMYDIDALRNKLCYHNGVIQLLLTSAGNSSLQRLESATANIESGLSDIKGIIRKSENAAAELPILSGDAVKKESSIMPYEFSELLMTSAEVSVRWTTIGIQDWINAGKWWLLKYQSQMKANMPEISERKCIPPSAYTTLIKASWILIDVITKHPQSNFLETSIRIRIQSLVKEIADEFNKIDRQGLRTPKLKELDRSELYVWEAAQIEPPKVNSPASPKSPIGLFPSLDPDEDNQFDIILERFGHFQHATGRRLPCLLRLLLHKHEKNVKVLMYDQSWKIHEEVDVDSITRPTIHCKDGTISIDRLSAVMGTDIEAKTLHVLLCALVEYYVWWYQPELDTTSLTISLLKTFAMLFALGFGYWEFTDVNGPDIIEDAINQAFDLDLSDPDPLGVLKQARAILRLAGTITSISDARQLRDIDQIALQDREPLDLQLCLSAMEDIMQGKEEIVLLWLMQTGLDDWMTLKLLYTQKTISLPSNPYRPEIFNDIQLEEKVTRFWRFYADNQAQSPLTLDNYELRSYCTCMYVTAELKDATTKQALLELPVMDHARNGITVPLAKVWPVEQTKLLVRAANKGYKILVEALLRTGANVNSFVIDRSHAGMECLVLPNVRVGSNASSSVLQGMTALQAAAESGHATVVEILLDAGADVNAPPANYHGRTALQAAAETGHAAIVEILLKAGANVNAQSEGLYGRTALQAAADSGHAAVVEILLKGGADVNTLPVNYHARTALQAAAESGHAAVVEILLKAGADVNAQSDECYGRTALQAAAQCGHAVVVQILLDAGADVNVPPGTNYWRTALQSAAESGHAAVVQILLKAGADVNALPGTFYGRSALQAAAESGHESIVITLLKAGADVNAEAAPHGGWMALQAAAKQGYHGIEQILRKAGDATKPPDATWSFSSLNFDSMNEVDDGWHLLDKRFIDY